MIEPIILYEDDFLICVVKPVGMPTQPDKTGDIDVVTFLNKYLQKAGEKKAHIGLIHRLDRPVGGLLLFSKRKEVDNLISKMMQENKIKKEYLAVVCGKTDEEAILENYLQKNEKKNISSVVKEKTSTSKKAVLTYKRMQMIREEDKYYSLLKVELKTGRHHQIRVQLSHAGIPIWGDQKYNTLQTWKKGITPALWAYQLTFKHFKTCEDIILQYSPKQEPFSKFTIFE